MGKETQPPAPAVTSQSVSSKQWPHTIDTDYTNNNQNLFHVDTLVNKFRDFARPNLFKVEFNLNSDYQNKFPFISKDKSDITEIMAKTFNIPNYEMGKLEIKRMGQRIILPSTMNIGECQASFYCDDNYNQRKFLHSWFHKHIYDYDTNIYRKHDTIKSCEIRVYQLDNKFNTIFGIKLNRAWPTSIGEIQYSNDSENSITEFPATFAFSTYEILSPDFDTQK